MPSSSEANQSPTFLPHMTHLMHTLNKTWLETLWSARIFLIYCKLWPCMLRSATGRTGSQPNFLGAGVTSPALTASLIAGFAVTGPNAQHPPQDMKTYVQLGQQSLRWPRPQGWYPWDIYFPCADTLGEVLQQGQGFGLSLSEKSSELLGSLLIMLPCLCEIINVNGSCYQLIFCLFISQKNGLLIMLLTVKTLLSWSNAPRCAVS